MTETGLKLVGDILSEFVDYEYMRFWRDFEKTYWVGESYVNNYDLELRKTDSTLLITGTTTGSWKDLIDDGEKIVKALNGLKRVINGTGISIYYRGNRLIDSDDESIKRIEYKFLVFEFMKGEF